jgi:hypothetical protein
MSVCEAACREAEGNGCDKTIVNNSFSLPEKRRDYAGRTPGRSAGIFSFKGTKKKR